MQRSVIRGSALLSRYSPGIAARAGLFGLTGALASSLGQTFFIGLFGADLRAELGLDDAQWGLFYGLATLASGILMFWLGELADRLHVSPGHVSLESGGDGAVTAVVLLDRIAPMDQVHSALRAGG